jgi:hypothetical protein
MDLRVPSGLFFTLVGLILMKKGFFAPETRAALTTVNVNLYSGICMLVFGLFLLALAWRAAKTALVTADDADLPFSIGAAGITVIWLFFHGRPGTALLLIGLDVILRIFVAMSGVWIVLALLVPLLVIFYFGSEGGRIAMAYKHYKSVAELQAGERNWTIAGAICLALFLILWVGIS